MRSWIWIAGLALLAGAGCAALQQVREDYEVGKETPYVHDEVPPAQEAETLVETLKAVPVVGNYANAVLPLLVGYFTWRRGRRLRRGMPYSPHPITGYAGKVLRIEPIVQFLADLQAGAFEVGKEGSAIRRYWKAAAAGVAAVALFAIPGVREFVTANAETVTELIGRILAYSGVTVAGVLGTEKALSIVKPIATPAPAGTPT